MTKDPILIVSDDPTLCQSIRDRMRNNCIEVTYSVPTMELLDMCIVRQYCLIILDISLEIMDRIGFLQTMRSLLHSPILVVDQELSSEKRVALFQAGADACIEKPVDLDVCVAQARSLLQLYKGSKGHCRPLTFGSELIISRCHRQVLVEGKPLQLTRKEFDLLHCLASSPGQVFSREQLYAHVWDEVCPVGGDETVKVHIKTLRKKLASAGKKYIQNVWGIGYKFVLSESETV